MSTAEQEIAVGRLDEIDDPGCREFEIGEGDWPFRGFVVRQGDGVYAYQNFCAHVGHPLNWSPDKFLTKDKTAIICASHGATYQIDNWRLLRRSRHRGVFAKGRRRHPRRHHLRHRPHQHVTTNSG